MKKTLKIAILFYFLLTDFILFAQAGPGDEDNNGGNGLEGGDPPTASINSKIWGLILIAIIYVCIMFKKRNRLNNDTDF